MIGLFQRLQSGDVEFASSDLFLRTSGSMTIDPFANTHLQPNGTAVLWITPAIIDWARRLKHSDRSTCHFHWKVSPLPTSCLVNPGDAGQHRSAATGKRRRRPDAEDVEAMAMPDDRAAATASSGMPLDFGSMGLTSSGEFIRDNANAVQKNIGLKTEEMCWRYNMGLGKLELHGQYENINNALVQQPVPSTWSTRLMRR